MIDNAFNSALARHRRLRKVHSKPISNLFEGKHMKIPLDNECALLCTQHHCTMLTWTTYIIQIKHTSNFGTMSAASATIPTPLEHCSCIVDIALHAPYRGFQNKWNTLSVHTTDASIQLQWPNIWDQQAELIAHYLVRCTEWELTSQNAMRLCVLFHILTVSHISPFIYHCQMVLLDVSSNDFLREHYLDHFDLILFKRLSCEISFSVYLFLDGIIEGCSVTIVPPCKMLESNSS